MRARLTEDDLTDIERISWLAAQAGFRLAGGEAANALEFEKAAHLRDKIKEIKAAPELGAVLGGPSKPRKPKPGTPGTKVIKKKRKHKPA